MKAILEFNLPEDQHDYDLANNASNYAVALTDIYESLRSKVKHGEPSEDLAKFYQDEFWEILKSNSVDLFN